MWCPEDAACRHMWRSKTIRETLAPKWDEYHKLPLTQRKALMHVALFDWDKVGTDDFLGEALVSLEQYLDGKPHTLELELDVLEDAPPVFEQVWQLPLLKTIYLEGSPFAKLPEYRARLIRSAAPSLEQIDADAVAWHAPMTIPDANARNVSRGAARADT